MQEKIETSNKRKAKTGEIIRALDIPIAELAQDDSLNQDEQRILIEQHKHQCGVCFGTAGPAFMQAVLDHFQTEAPLRAWLKAYIGEFHDLLVEQANARGHQLGPAHVRAMRRFALVAAVGTLAVQTDTLPFTEEAVLQAVSVVCEAWLSALPPLAEGERALTAIRDYVIRHDAQILNYDLWRAAGSEKPHLPRDMRAIRKSGLLLFTQEQFEQACGGLSASAALKQLLDRGMLKTEQDKRTHRVNIAELGIKRVAFYAIDATLLLSGNDLNPVQNDMDEPENDEGGDDYLNDDEDFLARHEASPQRQNSGPRRNFMQRPSDGDDTDDGIENAPHF